MVQIRNYLKNNSLFNDRKKEPMLNSLFLERFSKFAQNQNITSFKNFMKWARKCPQLMGFLWIIVSDIISDDVNFNPIGTSSGRNNVLKAKAFWTNNLGNEVVEETLYDLLINGIGYNWIAKLDDFQLKEMSMTVTETMYPNLEKKEIEDKSNTFYNLIKKHKRDKIPKKLRHIAASTVSINTDKYDVLSYIQRVGTDTKEFNPDEIITFKLIPFDGKVYPFPPMESILSEVYLLWLITQNYVSFFENGGKPDSVFILPKEIANSKTHQYLIDTLRKYKKIQNKHGNLVFTGDLTIEKLMDVEHQMENKDLGLYLVSVLAMMYGIPISRIPFLVGKAAIGGDAGGLADTGYWRRISVWQKKLEDGYNKNLWIPFFNVEMKFRRGYLQDEVRETQTEMQKNNVAEQRLRMGIWTIEKAAKYLNTDESILFEAQEQKRKRDEEELRTGMLRQGMESNDNVLKNQDQKRKALQKQETQKKNQTDAGGKKINP
jgi:phage portal protein BeeE